MAKCEVCLSRIREDRGEEIFIFMKQKICSSCNDRFKSTPRVLSKYDDDYRMALRKHFRLEV